MGFGGWSGRVEKYLVFSIIPFDDSRGLLAQIVLNPIILSVEFISQISSNLRFNIFNIFIFKLSIQEIKCNQTLTSKFEHSFLNALFAILYKLIFPNDICRLLRSYKSVYCFYMMLASFIKEQEKENL